MRMLLKGAAIALALAGTMVVTTGASSAAGFAITSSNNNGYNRGGTAISFSFGDVAYGYQDGFWDNSHRWHNWRNSRDQRDYRNHHGNNYRSGNHTRYHGQGWQRN